MAKRSLLGYGTSFPVPAFNPSDVQSHSYWGQYQYDASDVPNDIQGRTGSPGSKKLPNEEMNPLGNPEFSKLRTGDVASTAASGDVSRGAAPASLAEAGQQGLYVCVYPGTSGNGDAVWERLDEAVPVQQTVRDAHVIVVGQSGHLAGLASYGLNLGVSGDQLGITCDYLDPGDGSELSVALGAALAGGVAIDIRLRPCWIALTGTGGSPDTLAVPASCRLIGAGMDISAIYGTSGSGGVMQTVFTAGRYSAIEDLSVWSPAASGSPAASPVGVIDCDIGVEILRCSVGLQASESASRNGATNAISFNFGSNVTFAGDELVSDCVLYVDSLLGQEENPVFNAAISFLPEKPQHTTVDPEVRNTTIGAYSGKSCPTAVRFNDVEGGRCFNVEHFDADLLNSFEWSWDYNQDTSSQRQLRGPKFIECRGKEIDRETQPDEKQRAFYMLLEGATPSLAGGIHGAMFHDCVAHFSVPAEANGGASLRGFTIENASADESSIYDTTIDNCRVLNGHRGFVIEASDEGETPGRIISVRMTGCQARSVRATGANPARGAVLTGNTFPLSPTIVNVGIQNCDFSLAPATGKGIDIEDAGVKDSIVLGNNLTPAGGAAFTNGGTLTEAAHNIL